MNTLKLFFQCLILSISLGLISSGVVTDLNYYIMMSGLCGFFFFCILHHFLIELRDILKDVK